MPGSPIWNLHGEGARATPPVLSACCSEKPLGQAAEVPPRLREAARSFPAGVEKESHVFYFCLTERHLGHTTAEPGGQVTDHVWASIDLCEFGIGMLWKNVPHSWELVAFPCQYLSSKEVKDSTVYNEPETPLLLMLLGEQT